jgi:hypothetical protein
MNRRRLACGASAVVAFFIGEIDSCALNLSCVITWFLSKVPNSRQKKRPQNLKICERHCSSTKNQTNGGLVKSFKHELCQRLFFIYFNNIKIFNIRHAPEMHHGCPWLNQICLVIKQKKPSASCTEFTEASGANPRIKHDARTQPNIRK